MEDWGELAAFSVGHNGSNSSSSGAQVAFQWGGTLSALFLLLLNCCGRRSRTVTTLLVVYLLTSFPNALFKILRGQFGRWIAFIVVGANLFFPHIFTVSRFVLFVITPDWLANGLRNSIAGAILCLIIGVFLIISEFHRISQYRNCECTLSCFCYFLGMFLLVFFSSFAGICIAAEM